MATDKKLTRHATKRSASGSVIILEQRNEQVLQCFGDLANDHDFLAPYELCSSAIGLLFCLITKRLTGISFSNLYHRSQKRDWMDLLTRERRNLKANVNSIEKCFILNRLIAAYTQSSTDFARRATQLYEQIQTYMTCRPTWTPARESVFDEIEAYRSLQCQRRLFYINHDEAKQTQTVLSLQRATSDLYTQSIDFWTTDVSYRQTEGRNQFKKLFQHSFIIVVQPSTSECVAATKYEKSANTYGAKLNLRILCLLDVHEITVHFELSPIAVTLYLLDRQLDGEGEVQLALEWKKRIIIDAQGLQKSFYYAELHSIKLTKTDLRSSRPLYSSKLCQLQFQLKMRMKNQSIEEDVIFLSRPFGLCSHSQYFPEYVAKVLIHEIEQIPQITDYIIQPNIVTDFLCRYHTHITGIEPKLYTKEFILRELQTVYEARKTHEHVTSVDIYEGILSKLINQIEFFVDHPYLSMMYDDNLFLGICDSRIDNEMNGTPEQPHILLRFNAPAEHQSSQQASVRCIIHDGRLIKATFHSKAFVDDMCRMICESNSEKAKTIRILSRGTNRTFHDFSLYFDKELFRLSTISPPTKEAYEPLIPVLWRSTTTDRSKQLPSSPFSGTESPTLSISCSNPTETIGSSCESPERLTEKVTLQKDRFIHYLVEKLPEILLKLQISPTYPAEELTDQTKSVVSNLLRGYLRTMSEVHASTTTMIAEQNNTKSYSSFCSTATNPERN